MDSWCLFVCEEALGWKWYCYDAPGSLPLAEADRFFESFDLAVEDFERRLEDYKAMMAHRYLAR